MLAAAYGFRIARNHSFNDGNKRTALPALYTLLGLNGYDLEAPGEEAVQGMTTLADETLVEEGLADWIRLRSREFA